MILIAAVGLSLAIFMTAPWLVSSLLGDDFGDSAPVLRLLALAMLCNTVNQPLTVALQSRRFDRLAAGLVLASAATHLVVTLLLAPSMGGQRGIDAVGPDSRIGRHGQLCRVHHSTSTQFCPVDICVLAIEATERGRCDVARSAIAQIDRYLTSRRMSARAKMRLAHRCANGIDVQRAPFRVLREVGRVLLQRFGARNNKARSQCRCSENDGTRTLF